LVREELLDLKEKYGDERRTHIAEEDTSGFSQEDIIPNHECSSR